MIVMAVGALAGNVSVGQEHLGLLIVVLLAGLLDELAGIIQFAEKVRCNLMVSGGTGTTVDVV